jgi:DNA-binding MarR family transcriptional regulator
MMTEAQETPTLKKGSRMARPSHRPLTLLHAALQNMEALFAELDTGVTSRQWTLLEEIERLPGASQTQLSEATCMDRSTMVQVLDRLAAKQLVVKQRSETDRRETEVSLTAAGQALLRRRRRRVNALCDEAWQRAGGPDAPLREGLLRLSTTTE